MDILKAIVYGALQGLTEFLPISSSAHIRIAPALLGWPDPGAAFTANIQLGTILAVLIYFRSDLAAAIKGWIAGLTDKSKRDTPEYRQGWGIFYGSIPIVVLGFLLKDIIENQLRSLYVVAAMLIIMAIVLWVADKSAAKGRELDSATIADGVIIGLFQALALAPGASRSGSTISGALFRGFSREAAARFSFMLSVPSIVLAALYTAFSHRHEFSGMLVPLLVANLVSSVVGYGCIAFLMQFLKTKSNTVFVAYRIVLGVAIIALMQSGIIKN